MCRRLGPTGVLAPDGIESICAHFETNVIGILRMIQCFAPILAPNRGGAFLNVLSVASWVNSGAVTAYAVSKGAAWSMTNGLRNELRQQNTQVLGLHMSYVDTDLTKGVDVAKASPDSIVQSAFDALESVRDRSTRRRKFQTD
jgi:NAD(P)-dependent dehydrogenase (short-subunit alcohol dehydrogenase family)